ncbi:MULTISPECIES: glutarate dioxygenase GlaH [Cupriavidus]|uniref:Carbon starvation induced protein CsiD n=1 Tax=Cupriavidus basilensis TaxID=68895 RepID=A0A643G4R8_9BURK|nr:MULTISPECIES: glutarate dioxygenase GlaH [Cupriavidus]KUE88031.1 protein CsiD [Cupriavidus necator]NOV23809.1 carbon starvation induced protein CsiD [Cupriavidus necator]QOT81856.1 carbon starvation induced protein CsiD [Cupriavidus basilensis]BDB30283.1 carbon starvation induced protein CsiD [Cupriavidus sp. P-10]
MNAPLADAILSTPEQPLFHLLPHADHHRLMHVTADEAALSGFLDDARHVDVQNLEYVPFMRYHLANLLVQRLGNGFAQTLIDLVKNRRHGGFTMGLQGLSDDSADFVRLGTAVCHILGPSNHDAMSGTYYARFIVKHTDDSDSYLRQAYRLFTMHTDGTFVSEATDWLLMMKFSEENAIGGESRFLHLDDWDEIEQFVNHKLGTRPFQYKAPGSKNVSDRVERPIFFQSQFGLSMSFIDQFVQPADRDEAAFLHALSASMEASAGTKEVSLPVGDLVVLNNYFYLHGRAPFKKNESLFRELMRQRGTLAS